MTKLDRPAKRAKSVRIASGNLLERVLPKFKKLLISLFILAYTGTIGLWLFCPLSSRDEILRPIEPLILWSGLWQAWPMFCPNPRNVNMTMDVLIEYADGTGEIWQYPRMESLNFFERLVKERYRCFGYNYLIWDKEKALRPDFARFVARNYSRSGKKVATVKLVRHWADIPLPEIGLGKALPPLSEQRTFFIYHVKPGDLP